MRNWRALVRASSSAATSTTWERRRLGSSTRMRSSRCSAARRGHWMWTGWWGPTRCLSCGSRSATS
eukprot:8426348-Lingulodinium_polyedra.AAC.1